MDRKDQQTELSDPWCGHYLVTIICCLSCLRVHTLIRVRDGPSVRADTTDTYQEERFANHTFSYFTREGKYFPDGLRGNPARFKFMINCLGKV